MVRETGNDFDSQGEQWRAANTVGEFVFIVRNESGKTLNIFPETGAVQVGARQLDLAWDVLYLEGFDDVNGEIFKDVIKVGGFWFPMPRVELADVKTVILRFDAAFDNEYEDVGEAFVFEIDLSDLPNEPWDDSVVTP
jgi:hypothetical protein